MKKIEDTFLAIMAVCTIAGSTLFLYAVSNPSGFQAGLRWLAGGPNAAHAVSAMSVPDGQSILFVVLCLIIVGALTYIIRNRKKFFVEDIKITIIR